jgi:hypothetical protein
MLDFVKAQLQRIPEPTRPPVMTLADIVGAPSAQAIEATGHLRFHTVGDTGKGLDTEQGIVAQAMRDDFDFHQPAQSPAFFLHLGDVIYGHHKDQLYRPEFYEPYMHYPGKIIAVSGNHDGEVIPGSDPQTLRACLANLCARTAKVPPIAGTILRETMTQPGVYWRLVVPFIDLIGLYSNAAENPGFISGDVPGQAQKNWLIATLRQIAAERRQGRRKALVFATHHPPYSEGSQGGYAGPSGSSEMLADIDDACAKGGVLPDLFLSGHAHNYQRFTRRVPAGGGTIEIPYIVAGIGGHNAQPAPAAGHTIGDHSLVSSHTGYGYLHVEASAATIVVRGIGVDGATKAEFDHVSVQLDTRHLA